MVFKVPPWSDTEPVLTGRAHFWRPTRWRAAGRAKRRFAPARAAAKDDATGPKSLIPIIRFSARPKFSIIQPSASRPVDAAGVRSANVAVASDHRNTGLPSASAKPIRSEEHTSELQSLMRISYAVFCLTKKTHAPYNNHHNR